MVGIIVIILLLLLVHYKEKRIISPGLAGRPGFQVEGVSRARPEAARGTERSEYRTGEDVGEAEPLMPLERPKPQGKGAGEASEAPRILHP